MKSVQKKKCIKSCLAESECAQFKFIKYLEFCFYVRLPLTASMVIVLLSTWWLSFHGQQYNFEFCITVLTSSIFMLPIMYFTFCWWLAKKWLLDFSWDIPTLVAWGIADKYLPQSVAEEFQKRNPTAVKLQLIEGAGHMPQEDW